MVFSTPMEGLLRRTVLSTLPCGLVPGFGQPPNDPNTLTPDEKRSGWKMLFDGQSGKGWLRPSSKQFPNGFWIIEDGFLRGAPVGNEATDLASEGSYRNFDLVFEWKISTGGNSGLKYLVGSSQKLVFENNRPPALQGTVTPGPTAQLREYTSGLEYQLVDEEGNTDGKEPATRSGALYQLVGFDRTVARPAGELNRSRVLVSGNHVEHWLNGVKVVTADVTSAEFRRAAEQAPERTRRALQYMDKPLPIALQCHTGAIWFRNIKLREL